MSGVLRMCRSSDGVFDLHTNEVAKTSNYTILPKDNGTLFTNAGAGGAVTFTLPTRAAGYVFWFKVVADQSVTVASAAGSDMVVGNSATASSVAFTTASQKIGNWLKVYTNLDGSKWYTERASYLPAGLTSDETAYLASVTAGTVAASKAAVVDSNKDIGDFRNLDVVNLDAGASGTAGTVDVFPTTASKGKLAVSCTDQTGNTTVSLVAGAMAAARTLTIPDPLASCNFLMGTQAAVARTATSDGLTTGTIADGGILQHVTVTSADANNIIVLPTPTPGTMVVLNVGSNGFELRSSSPTTIAINGGTGAGAESAIPANSTVIMICVSATAWKGFYLDADSDLAKVEAAA